jgi:hypothetical protein
MLFFSCATAKPAEEENPPIAAVEEQESIQPQAPSAPPSLGTVEPFTNTLFDGLKSKMPSFLLSEEIVLHRESFSNEVSLEGNGSIIIQDLDNNGTLIFEKGAKGRAFRVEERGDERLIYVSFQKEGGVQDENTLIFLSNKNNPYGQFYLKAEKSGASLLNEEQSTIQYGGLIYNVRYNETNAPSLLVTVLRPNAINLGGVTTFPGEKNLVYQEE